MAGELKELPFDQPIRLRNVSCIYCGMSFDKKDDMRRRTKEHVIARKFVPHISFNKEWNLIANACNECNGTKADLEDDIAAITMQPNAIGLSPSNDSLFIDKARLKAKGAISRRTGKPVANSSETLDISGKLSTHASFSVTMVSPPQIPPERAFSLARFHVVAFFYFLTYQVSEKTGGFWPGSFAPIALVPQSDWGNDQIVGFQQMVAAWPHKFHGIGAGTYFKAMIRRYPDDETVWAWALEWNKSHRVFGFFGDLDACQKMYEKLPELRMREIEKGVDPKKGTFVTRSREEIQLADDEDQLFAR